MELVRRSSSIALACLILAACIYRFPADNMRAEFFFTVRCVAIIGFAAWLSYSINVWVGAFICLFLFSSFVPVYTEQSYLALDSSLAAVGVLALVYFTKSASPFLNVFCLAAATQTLFLVLWFDFGIDPYSVFMGSYVHDKGEFGGLTMNPNESAAMLAVCLPAFFRFNWYFATAGIAVVGYGLILSHSTGGFLAALAATSVFAVASTGSIVVALVAFTCAATLAAGFMLIIDPLSNTTNQRLEAWAQALQQFGRYDTGIGFGNWKVVYPEMLKAGIIREGFIRLHNTWLQGFIEMGAGFVFCTIGAAQYYLRKLSTRTAMSAAGIAAFCVAGLFNSYFRINAINGMLAMVWIAIFIQEAKYERY